MHDSVSAIDSCGCSLEVENNVCVHSPRRSVGCADENVGFEGSVAPTSEADFGMNPMNREETDCRGGTMKSVRTCAEPTCAIRCWRSRGFGGTVCKAALGEPYLQ